MLLLSVLFKTCVARAIRAEGLRRTMPHRQDPGDRSDGTRPMRVGDRMEDVTMTPTRSSVKSRSART